MLRHERSAPIWLFSFVDLAFLLLIAFTQIGPDRDASSDVLATIEVPRIHGDGKPIADAPRAPGWQLRILPPASGEAPGLRHAPFHLVEAGAPAVANEARADDPFVDAEELAARLSLLSQRELPRPLLAPHRDARSEDLLVAVSLLEDAWQGSRRVVVRSGPPVAAAPPVEAQD